MKIQVANLGKVAITVEEQPWSINKAYDRNTIVEDNFTSYISRIPVPKGQPLVNNRKYWVPFSTRNGSLSVSSFKLITDETQLPRNEEDNDGPYLIGSVAYFWVGTGGNAVDEMYQSINIQGPAGSDGADGVTPHIGEDGNWWIGETNTYKPSKGKDGKDGKDGEDGINGTNGTDGKNGYTPTIGSNGNWFINGKDTGKPSRGPQGPQGPPGGGSSNNVYIDEENKRLVFVVESVDTEHIELFTPPINGAILKIQSPSTYVDVQVHGMNLTVPVVFESNDTNKFTVKYGDGTPAGSVSVPADAANSDDIAVVRIIPNPSAGTAMGFTSSVSVYSENDEFERRYISVQYINRVTPNMDNGGGMVGPGSGTTDGNQGNVEVVN